MTRLTGGHSAELKAREPPGGWEPFGDDPGFGKATKADDAAELRRMRAADKAQAQPYKDAYAADQAKASPRARRNGSAPATAPAAKSSPGASQLLAPAGGGRRYGPASVARAGGTGAGVLFGAVAMALGFAYLDYGPAGPRAWLAAKFLNRSGGIAGAAANQTATATNRANAAGANTYNAVVSAAAGNVIYHGGV